MSGGPAMRGNVPQSHPVAGESKDSRPQKNPTMLLDGLPT